jgi:activator of 2-hydroxyglutaryl-CoA dehydratase
VKLGFDFGSKNIHAVVVKNNVIMTSITRAHNGDKAKEFSEICQELFSQFPKNDFTSIGMTGSIDLPGLSIIDPILASVEANKALAEPSQNVLSIGCESFYLIILDETLSYREHSVNSDCASGTGSFIDQQAERLGYGTEVLSKRAFDFDGSTPSIATRCAVFAKSDIIHAQAQGFSKDAIASGICGGVARSILSNVVKGRKLEKSLLCIGGVSQNSKIIDELQNNLSIPVRLSDYGSIFNAFGAALLGQQTTIDENALVKTLHNKREIRPALSMSLTNYPNFSEDPSWIENEIEITQYNNLENIGHSYFMGIDIGSTSTKAIILDEHKSILFGLYTRTKGDPIQAVSQLLNQIKSLLKNNELNLAGVATTGSEEHLFKMY